MNTLQMAVQEVDKNESDATPTHNYKFRQCTKIIEVQIMMVQTEEAIGKQYTVKIT